AQIQNCTSVNDISNLNSLTIQLTDSDAGPGRDFSISGNSIGITSLTNSGTDSSGNEIVSVTLNGGAGAVLQGSSGSLILSGNSITGGVVSLGSGEAIAGSVTISFGGGTLQYSAVNTTDYSGRFSAVANQAYRVDTNGQIVTFASGLSSSGGSLTKLGNGTLA